MAFNEFEYIKKQVELILQEVYKGIPIRWSLIQKNDEDSCTLYYDIEEYRLMAKKKFIKATGSVHYVVTNPKCSSSNINLLLDSIITDYHFNDYVELSRVAGDTQTWSMSIGFDVQIPLPLEESGEIEEVQTTTKGEYV